MEKLYGNKVELKNADGEILYTIKELTYENELDLDIFYGIFNKTIVAENTHDIFTIAEKMDRKDVIDIARWGRKNITEFGDESISYFEIVSGMYLVLIAFFYYRAELKKK